MPPRKRNEILRVKRNEKSVDTSEGSHIGAGDDFTPTENRTNLAHDETADAALSHQGEDDGTSDNVDMEEHPLQANRIKQTISDIAEDD